MPKLRRTFIMPGLPPRELSPNYRGQFSRGRMAEVSTAKQQARSDMLAVVRSAGWFGPGALYATLTITFVASDRRKRDFDNLYAACKPWQDGLVMADVLQYDDTAHLAINLRYRVEPGGEARTEFEVKER